MRLRGGSDCRRCSANLADAVFKSIEASSRPEMRFRDPGVKKVGFLMLPAVFGASVSQINILLDTVLASFLEQEPLLALLF